VVEEKFGALGTLSPDDYWNPLIANQVQVRHDADTRRNEKQSQPLKEHT
jgi:hypothetical protein